MNTFGSWFRRATASQPGIAQVLEQSYAELMEDEFGVHSAAEYPWNSHWIKCQKPAAWLRSLITMGDDRVVEEWIRSRALLPAPEEEILCRLAGHFRASAGWVFLLHGNVRDYVFDAHLGYAPFSDVLESYWLETGLFRNIELQPEAITIRYLLSVGVHIKRVSESAHGLRIRKSVDEHHAAVEKRTPEERLTQDLAFLSTMLEDPSLPPILLFFERPGLIFPQGSDHFRISHSLEHILRWASQAPPLPRHLIVLAADSLDEVNPELRKRVNGIAQIEVSRPARPVDRCRFILACMAASGPSPIEMPCTRLRSRVESLPFGVERIGDFADATAGLNYAGIETCVLNMIEGDVHDADAALRYLKEQRSELLKAESEGLIMIIEPTLRLRDLVGGMEAVTQRLLFVVRALSDARPAARLLAPMGILFVGPPGTGKSLTAEALAAECEGKVHYVKMGDFRDMWVGQSERNFARILKLLETFGKVIVFMDEIDQTEGGSRSQGAQHETSRRIFGKLLEFMANQEHRGRILWIAATNMPSSLDPALLRPGRFDLILPFEPPEAEGCVDILRLHLNPQRHGLVNKVSDQAIDTVAAEMAKRSFTGAEIQFVVTEAARRAFMARSALEDTHLTAALEDYTASQKDTPEYQRMVEECAKFVPLKSLRKKLQ